MVMSKDRLDFDSSDKLFVVEPTVIYAEIHERLVRCQVTDSFEIEC